MNKNHLAIAGFIAVSVLNAPTAPAQTISTELLETVRFEISDYVGRRREIAGGSQSKVVESKSELGEATFILGDVDYRIETLKAEKKVAEVLLAWEQRVRLSTDNMRRQAELIGMPPSTEDRPAASDYPVKIEKIDTELAALDIKRRTLIIVIAQMELPAREALRNERASLPILGADYFKMLELHEKQIKATKIAIATGSDRIFRQLIESVDFEVRGQFDNTPAEEALKQNSGTYRPASYREGFSLWPRPVPTK